MGDVFEDQRDEVAVVDSHCNLRLPSDILAGFKGLSSVKIAIKGIKIVLSPLDK